MTNEAIAEVAHELTEHSALPDKPGEERTNTCEMPFYIVPAPPIPGKTAWSVTLL